MDPIESQITFGLLLILVILVLPQGLVAGIRTRYIWLKSGVVALVMQRPSATLARERRVGRRDRRYGGRR